MNIELGNNDESNVEESFPDTNKSIELKLEFEDEENDSFDQMEIEYLEDEHADLYSDVNEEGCQLKLLKEEVKEEGEEQNRGDVKIKSQNKEVNKGKVKGKSKKGVRVTTKYENIETIKFTKKQCMEERTKLAAEEKYINSPYKCESCIKMFYFKAAYDKHMEKHRESNGDFQCDVCRQIMHSESKLRIHSKLHYIRFKCSKCELITACVKSVKVHYKIYHCENDLQKCPHCLKTFTGEYSLNKHLKRIHSSEDCELCSYCGRTYKSEALRSHLLTKHPNEVSAGEMLKRYVCNECGIAFSFRSSLKKHSLVHSNRRDFYCVECDKGFKSQSLLTSHLKVAKRHREQEQRPFACDSCDKKYRFKPSLEGHINKVHLIIQPYKCDKCDKAYSSSDALRIHKIRNHENPRGNFPCTMCDKSFDTKSKLTTHQKKHTQVPFGAKLKRGLDTAPKVQPNSI